MASFKDTKTNSKASEDLEAGKPMVSTNTSTEELIPSKFSKNKWLIFGLAAFFAVILIAILVVCSIVFFNINHTPPQTQSQSLTIKKPLSSYEDASNVGNDEERSSELAGKMSDDCQVVVNPRNQSLPVKTNAHLECKFNHPVKCLWLRRSTEVEINKRYVYSTPPKEEGNYDCSISITSFRAIDFGDWTCVGLFEDQSNVQTRAAWLTDKVEQVKKINISPQDAQVTTGAEVLLRCEFDTEVDCVWLRRGEHIEVVGRYSYVDKPHSRNCSLRIAKVKEIDGGEWQCSSLTDSESNSITSQSASVTILT